MLCILALAGLGGAAIVLGRRIPRGTISQPGPGLFPFWLAIVLLLLCGWLALRILLGQERERGGRPGVLVPWQVLGAVAALYGYVLVLPHLGYEAATAVLVGFLLWLFGAGPGAMLVVSVVASGLTAWLFGVLLQVPLPLRLFGVQ